MTKYLMPLLAVTIFSPLSFAAAKRDVVGTDSLKVGKTKYTIQYFGPAEFCDYDSLEIKKGAKVVLSLKHRCGREAHASGGYVVAGGKWVKVVKLGPKASDTYFYFLDEPSV